MLLFAFLSVIFLVTFAYGVMRDVWWAIQARCLSLRCFLQFWMERGWPTLLEPEDYEEQERPGDRPRLTSQLSDQDKGDSENPKSPRPTRRSSETLSRSSPEGGSGSSSEAQSLAAIRRINRMVAGPRVPALRTGSSPSPSPPLYTESLCSEIGRQSSAGASSPAQAFLAVAKRLKSERKSARSKASGPAGGQAESGPASRRGRGPPVPGRTSGSSADHASGAGAALVTYSGSSADLPARVVSPYYSEAARFPAPEGIEGGRMPFEGGVLPMRVLPGGCSVVVTCGQPVDGSLADSQQIWPR
jgi:hypothetical protein